MSWKFSVAEFIPPMLAGKRYRTQFAADHAAGVGLVNVSDGNGRYNILQGDYALLGPSNATDNLGATEQIMIQDHYASSSYEWLNFHGSTQYKYSSSDYITVIGSATAKGWEHVGAGDAVFELQGCGAKTGSTGIIREGYVGPSTGQWLELATGTTSYHSLFQYMRRPLLTSTLYRMGVYLRQSGNNGNLSSHGLWDGTNYIITNDIKANATAWSNVEGTGTTNASGFGDAEMYFYWDDTTEFSSLVLDFPYLTHAALTSGAASGVYTLTQDPIDINSFVETADKSIRFFPGLHRGYVDALDKLPVRGFRFLLENCDATLLRQLELLTYWQGCGNLLMIEPDIVGNLNDKPIVGLLDYSISYRHWDDSLAQVDVVFKGI